MTFGYFSGNLVADGPVMEINVVAGVPAVPQPATYALFVAGLGVLSLMRLRRTA